MAQTCFVLVALNTLMQVDQSLDGVFSRIFSVELRICYAAINPADICLLQPQFICGTWPWEKMFPVDRCTVSEQLLH